MAVSYTHLERVKRALQKMIDEKAIPLKKDLSLIHIFHVDGDVFIWTKIDESLRDHELIVQNEETTTDYYGKMWRDIRHAISYMPEEMKRYDLHIDNKAYNMGIFGGTDIDFIQRYTYKAFDFSIK